jgi:hypothetical protein
MPSLILPNSDIKLIISSDKFNLNNVAEIQFKHKNGEEETIRSFTNDKTEIIVYVRFLSETDTIELTQIKDIKGHSIIFNQQFVINPKEFNVITDRFFNVKDNRILIQIVSNKNGQITINSAQTDKGLQFKGNQCVFNTDCYLELVERKDNSELIGLSKLTIIYGDNLTMTVDSQIIIRNENPTLINFKSDENSKSFLASYSQNMYEAYFTSGKVYISLSTQSGEFKCTCKTDDTPKVLVTCPVSSTEGLTIYSFIMDSQTLVNVTNIRCENDQIVYNDECVYCKDKDVTKPIFYNSKCYSVCPEGTYQSEYQCVDSCPKNIQNGKCVDKCSDGYGLGSTLQNKCYKCKTKGQVLSDGYCIKSCPEGLIYNETLESCIYMLKIHSQISTKLSEFCKNNGELYTQNNILKCSCPEGFYGYQCTYTEEQAKIEADKLYLSIFSYGTIGNDGKIQTVVPIDYDSEELLKSMSDLIDLLRNDTFNPNE